MPDRATSGAGGGSRNPDDLPREGRFAEPASDSLEVRLAPQERLDDEGVELGS